MARWGWDVTTADGREALEQFLMERMGFQRKDGVWAHKDGGHVDEGWLFGGDGMVWAKEWAATRNRAIVVESRTLRDGSGEATAILLERMALDQWDIFDDAAEEAEDAWFSARASDEPTAVALALARALEEMEKAV